MLFAVKSLQVTVTFTLKLRWHLTFGLNCSLRALHMTHSVEYVSKTVLFLSCSGFLLHHGMTASAAAVCIITFLCVRKSKLGQIS